MENADVARVFDELADLLEIKGENVFRVRAYRNAARTLESLPTPVARLLERGEEALCELPGIGRDLAGKIHALVDTGRLPLLDELLAEVPEGLVTMMRVEGLGPKRARLIHDRLGIDTLDALEAAAREGRLHALRGIGPALEHKLLDGIAKVRARGGRFRLDQADAWAASIRSHLEGAEGLLRLEIAGSYRRRKETVGDLDVLAAATARNGVAERFLAHPDAARVLARGDTRCAIALTSGVQVDLRIVREPSFGAALHYFTGSKAHNIAIRTLGLRRGLKINEYGVFRRMRRIAGRTEEEIYAAVGLPYIPPELREDRGEIDAARAGTLPRLVEPADLRGDLQMHTSTTDGHDTLAAMVAACRDRGHSYIAITDHTAHVRVTRGLDRAGFRAQRRALEALRKTVPGLTILHGAEVDILDDGSLDLDEQTLAELDLVLVAVHSKLNMPKDEMTRRVLRALAHPRVNILAHPTGRLLGRRDPIAIDLDAVIAAAVDRGVLLEINAQPERLDLADVYVRMARDAGARFVISTDAHRVAELGWLRYGVDVARRGWCTPRDIVNTYPLAELRRALHPARAA